MKLEIGSYVYTRDCNNHVEIGIVTKARKKTYTVLFTGEKNIKIDRCTLRSKNISFIPIKNNLALIEILKNEIYNTKKELEIRSKQITQFIRDEKEIKNMVDKIIIKSIDESKRISKKNRIRQFLLGV